MSYCPVDQSALCALLRRVFLAGTIPEVLLVVSGKIATIQAIDPGSTVYVSTSERIQSKKESDSIPDCKLGIMDVSAFMRVLAFSGNVAISITEKTVSIRCSISKARSHTVRFRLIDAKNITTAVEDSAGSTTKLEKQTPIVIPLTQEIVDDILLATNLVPVSSLTFAVEDGVLKLSTPKEGDSSFACNLGKVEVKSHVGVSVYPKQFLEALRIADIATGASIRIGDKAPLVLQQKGCVWAFTPVDSDTGSNTDE